MSVQNFSLQRERTTPPGYNPCACSFTEDEFAGFAGFFTPHLIDFSSSELGKVYRDFCLAEAACLAEPMDYLKYQFFNLKQKRWNDFITRRQYVQICSRFNKPADERIIADKALFSERYKKLLGRNVVLAVPDNIRMIEMLCETHKQLVIKPVEGGYGRGIRIMQSVDKSALRKLLEEENYIIEEKIEQHDATAEFHPSSVNTVRLVVLKTEKSEPHIVSAVFRCGRNGAVTDNADGLFAAVNQSTGEISSDGKTHTGESFSHHPDTGTRFKGFRIPYWSRLYSSVVEASGVLPELKVINWDYALRSDGEWILIEGNAGGGIGPGQVASGRGMRKAFEAFLGDI